MPIKNKQINKKLQMFFNEYKIPDTLSIPFFIDGYYETVLFKNKEFYCNFYSNQIANMWNDIYYNKDTLISFLINKDYDLEILEEVFRSDYTSMLKSLSLINSMCNSNEVLFGKQNILYKNRIIDFLKETKPKIHLSKNKDLVSFQDLSYLSEQEIDTCFEKKEFIFISNKNINKTNTTSIEIDDNLFVLWRFTATFQR